MSAEFCTLFTLYARKETTSRLYDNEEKIKDLLAGSLFLGGGGEVPGRRDMREP